MATREPTRPTVAALCIGSIQGVGRTPWQAPHSKNFTTQASPGPSGSGQSGGCRQGRQRTRCMRHVGVDAKARAKAVAGHALRAAAATCTAKPHWRTLGAHRAERRSGRDAPAGRQGAEGAGPLLYSGTKGLAAHAHSMGYDGAEGASAHSLQRRRRSTAGPITG